MQATVEGRRVLLHMMAGSKEDAETVTAFFEDNMKRRGLNDPLLVTSDVAAGIIKAIEICFPRAARQRLPGASHAQLGGQAAGRVWPEFKVRAQAAPLLDMVVAQDLRLELRPDGHGLLADAWQRLEPGGRAGTHGEERPAAISAPVVVPSRTAATTRSPGSALGGRG
jgi:hypothetical protein